MTLNRGTVQGQGPVRGVAVLMLTDVKRILVWCSESVNSGLWKVLCFEDDEGRKHFAGLESVRAFINMNCVGYSIEEGKVYEGG